MSEPLISIIVPVYMAEELLPRCVNSLLRQSYAHTEIILIDDGSTDGCAAICDEYATKDARVRVHHQANAGVSTARNKGIELATGEFLCFVDADDYVSADYICNFAKALEADTDMVFQGFIRIQGNQQQHLTPCEHTYTAQEITEGLADIHDVDMTLFGFGFTKIFRRSHIMENHLRFREDISLCEDRIFALEYLRYARKLRCINKAAYYYEMHPGGLLLKKRSAEEIRRVTDTNLCVADRLIAQYPSPRFLDITRNTYITGIIDVFSTLVRTNAPWAQIYHATYSFGEAGYAAWLPLYAPTNTLLRIIAAALQLPPVLASATLFLCATLRNAKARLFGTA